MKIGIITQPLRLNYGGLLQNYALQTVLKRMGHHVVTLDRPFKLTTPAIIEYVKRLIRKFILRRNTKIFIEKNFNNKFPILSQNTSFFIHKYINRIEIDNLNTLNNKDFGALVVGSDQVWRPIYNKNIRTSFLDFARNWSVKRLAYAASFGTSEWEFSKSEEKDCRELAQLFDTITVREYSGISLCEEKLGVNAQFVLDPTMLLTKEDYNKLIDDTVTELCKGNLFCYILDENKQKSDFIHDVSLKLNLKPFTIGIENYNEETVKSQPKVEQWLRSFRDSDFIITDSFHACVFSILYNKPFYVIGNEGRGLSRFKSLLKTFALENRLITENQDITDVNLNNIDYNEVNLKLDEMRKKSNSVINNSLI